MKSKDKIRKEVVSAWKKAATIIGFKIITPYVLKSGHNEYEYVAFLPDFGGESGAVIDVIFPPDYSSKPEAVNIAESEKIHYSAPRYIALLTKSCSLRL